MRGQESDHIRFEPGTYYIGDPCYVIADKDWMDYLEAYGEGWGQGNATNFQGHRVWHNGTAFGDGTYRGSDGVEYAVDAGIIGIIPDALISEKYEHIKELGRIVTFDEPFFVWSEKDSTFHFGNITIVTDGSDYEDEEEDEDEQAYCAVCASNEVDYDGDTCDSCLEDEEEEDEE